MAQTARPDWWYDDARQVGLDFADSQQVATYDARQGGSSEKERALLQRLALKPHETMADIGCGTGILVREAAWMCETVHAIDISAAMLAAARGRAETMGLRNIRFQQAGFLTFDLPEAGLDLITAKYALHHLPDFWKGQALVRMARALKPGGRLYIEDVAFPDDPAEGPHAVEAWSAFMVSQTGYSRGDVATHVRDEYSTFRWVLEGLIERAGFELASSRFGDGVYGAWLAIKRS